jgi:serine/threonine protein kinase/tetratricopeptide (TPR) repeat protein
MRSETDALLDLAAAIADGADVDWGRVEDTLSESDQRRLVEQLRLIAIIAGVHRSHDDPTEPTTNPEGPPSGTTAKERLGHAASDLGRWGELILMEEVGQGSFGTVYRAHDPQLDRLVAVKLLRPTSSSDEQLASRLLHEGRTLAQVRHPNVVTVYGAGDHEGRVGLWMEFVRGLTLEQMLARHGRFSAGEAGVIGHELCGALAAVHHAGLVHRDVKAQNVMREEGGRLVLMDFGAGQKRSEPGAAGRRVVGTPLYLAPEVLTGAEATIASDVYSLGVLLYHLVTNDFPVKGATLRALRSAHERGAVTPLQDARPDLQGAFVHIVERAIERDPARRFASARQMEAAFARVQWSSVNEVVTPRHVTVSKRRTRGSRPVAPPRDADVPSVAVLPFSDMSPAKDQEYFCDGIAEELINALTQISGLRVAARTSAFQFKGRARDIRQIGAALNVATVLDGSVRKDGNRLRVAVELIGSIDGYQLWSERFDRNLEDVFAVQDEIAHTIVSTLKGKLAADKSAVVVAPRRDLDAYRFYLEGRYHWNKRTEDELKRSVGCFERAIDRDPDYAQAYAGMADAYVTLGTYGATAPRDVMPRAKRAVEKALEIDGGLAEAYTCRGCVRSVFDWSWADAERDFRRAIELKPSYPTAHHWYAINHLVPLGRFDEATEELHHALDLDPLALAITTSQGMKCYFAGRYDDAVRELSKTIELDESFGLARFFLGATYTELSKYAEALGELEVAIRLSGRSPESLAALGYLHGVSGHIDSARGVLDELKRLAGQRYVSPARLAQVHVSLGERAEALGRLEEAHAERAADLAWLGVRPVFRSLHAEPRFAALLKQMALATAAPM